jgi:uncharacterized membrane protein
MLRVERRSGAQFGVLNITPETLTVGSKDNIIKITIENTGYDTARDLVARLRPESGIYVSVDESPIPLLVPGESADLVYKVDISKDAIGEKRYLLKLLFEFSDSYRDDLTDSENAYLMVEQGGTSILILGGFLILVAAIVAFIVIRRRRRAKPGQ